ncbi:MAG: ABC transporter permease [Chitinophagaceae bacterium]|nr:ABC transporter permease [Chitinophagaceae bacterium]
MSKPYSQAKALWAITKASFKAIFSQPAGVFFSLMFPIIFIMIFGSFGRGGGVSYRIALEPGCDTSNFFFMGLRKNPQIRINQYPDTAAMNKDLEKGRITAVLDIEKVSDTAGKTYYSIKTRSTSASGNTFPAFRQSLDYVKLKVESSIPENKVTEYARVEEPVVTNVKQYRQIDFILPGQLGFSILFSTLFGIAFTFFGLREQLVLKRFYASPVSRINILLGIGTSRLFFQLMNVIVLIVAGHFFFGFTLRHGLLTVMEIILMSVIMLFLLLAVGFIFSSISKSDNNIPLLINLFAFPQMLLSGTFFTIEVFPPWLQSVCRILPLTQYNDAVRKISFEGLSILDCGKELGILAIWMLVIYAICAKVIKWE